MALDGLGLRLELGLENFCFFLGLEIGLWLELTVVRSIIGIWLVSSITIGFPDEPTTIDNDNHHMRFRMVSMLKIGISIR